MTAKPAPPPASGTSRRQPHEAVPRRVLFVTDFYREDLLAGIVSHAATANWELDADMRHHGQFPPTEGADGILATGCSQRMRAWLAAHASLPVVHMPMDVRTTPLPAVCSDYVAAGRAGAEHLLELGHVHFAFYCGHRGPETVEALQGFEGLLRAARRPFVVLELAASHPDRDYSRISLAERHRWLASQLALLPRPLAVMCDDDRRALEMLAACRLAGRRLPEDVAVLGCDNHWVAQGMSPVPLSSVDMNFKGIGRRAAELLDGWMRGGPRPVPLTTIPPVGVVARRSTAAFVTDSPGITAAVLHLREHFREPVRLAELLRLAGMSERAFEREFKRRVGRSARAELQRLRIVCAARLLRDTELKLSAIAAESGFGSASKLCKAFAEAHGASPSNWRQRSRS